MKQQLYFVTKRFLFLLMLYTLFRVLYLGYNYKQFVGVPTHEIVTAFLLGARFDIAAILMVNGLFFILWLLPVRALFSGHLAKVISGFFYLINFIFVAMNVADVELIHFSGQKLTLNYFKIAQDIEGQSTQLLMYYWPMTLVLIGFGLALILLMPKIYFEKINFEFNVKQVIFRTVAIFVFLFLAAFGIRGGWQNKPLREAHAYTFDRNDLGHLTINSTFSFLRSSKNKGQTRLNFFKPEEIQTLLHRDRTPHFKNKWSQPQNVLVIILESFALEYVSAANNGVGYTPFFDELAQKGLLFTNFFANGRRSIEAIPAILASVPSLLSDAFLTSNYQGTEIRGLGQILGDHGYETAFFHGAENGSMFFDSFTKRIGFRHYFGLNEYPNKAQDYDGFWGIFDEPYFQYIIQKINGMPKPFGVAFFSLSSHQPFTVPKQYVGVFKKGTLPIHETIGYADHALKKFFETAEKQSWFKNTLFVITGDHTSLSDLAEYQNDLGRYRVPLLLYHPGAVWPAVDLKRPAQHIDIMPTILDVLNMNSQTELAMSLVGTSVFSKDEDAFVVNHPSDGYWYLNKDQFVKLDLQFSTQENADLGPITRLKAYLQYVINGLVDNMLFERRR